MKFKGIILLVSLTLLLTGCSSKSIDFTKLETSLLSIQSETIDLSNVVSAVEIDEEILPKMDYIYINDMIVKFGINGSEYFDNVVIRVPMFTDDPTNLEDSLGSKPENDENLEIYMVLEAKEDKYEEAIIELDKFFDSLEHYTDAVSNMIKTEIDGYIVYIMADNAEQILNLIIGSNPKLFSNYISLEKEQFENRYGVGADLIDELFVKVPYMSSTEATLIIIKAENGQSSKIRNLLDDHFDNIESQVNYVDYKSLLSNRMYKRIGNYLIYIITTDNDKVYEVILDSVIE